MSKILIALLLLSFTACGVILHVEKVTLGVGTTESIKNVSEVAKNK